MLKFSNISNIASIPKKISDRLKVKETGGPAPPFYHDALYSVLLSAWMEWMDALFCCLRCVLFRHTCASALILSGPKSDALFNNVNIMPYEPQTPDIYTV